MDALRRFWRALVDLALPRRAACVGCGSLVGCDVDWLCARCADELGKLWAGGICFFERSPALRRAHAFAYRGPVPRLVRALKYGSAAVLAAPMAREMARSAGALELPAGTLVTPVPMRRRRRRRRGYNQAELLSREVARNLGLKHVMALEKKRETRRQATLSREERAQNLVGSMRARLPLEGRTVLLVDDVYTTGATARACAEALLRAGAAGVRVLTFAAVAAD